MPSTHVGHDKSYSAVPQHAVNCTQFASESVQHQLLSTQFSFSNSVYSQRIHGCQQSTRKLATAIMLIHGQPTGCIAESPVTFSRNGAIALQHPNSIRLRLHCSQRIGQVYLSEVGLQRGMGSCQVSQAGTCDSTHLWTAALQHHHQLLSHSCLHSCPQTLTCDLEDLVTRTYVNQDG